MTDRQPNILLIMPDQMRGDCLGLAGHPALLTPNLDALGRQGAHFTRAYSTCPSCIPARLSLLTGRFPSTHGMVGFVGGYPVPFPTLPQLLCQGGYQTVLTGRWMHQHPESESYGYEKEIRGSTHIGHDRYARFLERVAPGSGQVTGHGISFNGWTAKPWHLPEWTHPTNWVVTQARGFLAARRGNRPLFLTVDFYAPHPPLIPPAFYLERYLRLDLPEPAIGEWAIPPPDNGRGLDVESPRVVLQGEALRCALAGYFGLINHIDDQIYWLTREFQAISEREKRPWLVLFSSDHGEMLGDHCYFRKCEPYEGSARIPLLAQGSPELGLRRGVVCDRPVCLEDLLPTCLEAAGLPAPAGLDGRSLLPVLRDETDRVRDVLHGEHSPCYSQEQAFHSLTDGRWKYIWRPLDGREQLFNLESDPQELRDGAQQAGNGHELRRWRQRMVAELQGRPEGFTDGRRLIAGRPYHGIMANAPGITQSTPRRGRSRKKK